MPSTDNKLLQSWFAPLFKKADFKKTAATWQRRQGAFIHVFNIQGSQWSPFFYFNLGVYCAELGELERPTESLCHIRERLDALVPDRERFLQLSDFEQEIPPEERRVGLEAAVLQHAIPWLSQMVTKDRIRTYVQSEKQHSIAIMSVVYQYLEIEPEVRRRRSEKL